MIPYIKGIIKNLLNPAVAIGAIVDNLSIVNKKAKLNRWVKFVNSTIGKYSYVGGGSCIVGTEIGNFCSIAHDVQIGLAGHTLDLLSTSPIFTEKSNGTGYSWVSDDTFAYKNRRTIIGSDVWIGHGAKILSGISVNHGAVIAAGAVVTKDVPPYAIVGGIPAKIIRFRFNDKMVAELLQTKWWLLSTERIKEKLDVFRTANIDNMLIANTFTPPRI